MTSPHLSPGVYTALQQFVHRGHHDTFERLVRMLGLRPGDLHRLGLEVHELPVVSDRRPRDLQDGLVFTVEPGIYLPGQYGVRIEDAVAVTYNGCELLSDRSR